MQMLIFLLILASFVPFVRTHSLSEPHTLHPDLLNVLYSLCIPPASRFPAAPLFITFTSPLFIAFLSSNRRRIGAATRDIMQLKVARNNKNKTKARRKTFFRELIGRKPRQGEMMRPTDNYLAGKRARKTHHPRRRVRHFPKAWGSGYAESAAVRRACQALGKRTAFLLCSVRSLFEVPLNDVGRHEFNFKIKIHWQKNVSFEDGFHRFSCDL